MNVVNSLNKVVIENCMVFLVRLQVLSKNSYQFPTPFGQYKNIAKKTYRYKVNCL